MGKIKQLYKEIFTEYVQPFQVGAGLFANYFVYYFRNFFIRVFDIILIVGILRGGGDAKRALLIEGFTTWFIGVPLTILGAFIFKLPIYMVYALALLEEIAKGILGIIRLKSGRWTWYGSIVGMGLVMHFQTPKMSNFLKAKLDIH